ncbi:small subunit processome component 20 homolog [Hetaerina americana]|uniref:small subunit processome component 20 homolog n=1 Tax=Hetaerina americana TaxID=62018 RepID=UPI003A7F19FD
MKNRPRKHKESNTFRFLPFADRIAAIDVDVFHHIDRRRGIYDEGKKQTFLYLALEKWSVLNCTDSYAEFRSNFVPPEDIETLPQLVLHSKLVATKLLKSLKSSNYLCLQPVLECVVALAKDLRHDVYQYFPSLMIRIINILTAPMSPEGRGQKEVEIAEWCLSCLAHLCKILWRSMLKDWKYVYGSLLLPLILMDRTKEKNNFNKVSISRHDGNDTLSRSSGDAVRGVINVITEDGEKDTIDRSGGVSLSRMTDIHEEEAAEVEANVSDPPDKMFIRCPPDFVRDFIVQSFAFVARKAKDKYVFLESVLNALRMNTSRGIPWSGQLLAEVMKGVQGHFHSCAESMLPLLLELSCKYSDDPSDYFVDAEGMVAEEEKSISFQLGKRALVAVMSVIQPQKEAWLFWKALIEMVEKCVLEYKVNKDEKHRISLVRALLLLHTAVDFNKGQWLISDIKHGNVPIGASNILLSNQLANLLTSILRIPSLDNSVALHISGLVGSVLSSPAVAQGSFRLEQEVASKLTSQVLMYHHPDIVLTFVRRTVNFSGFETLILPHLITFCCNHQPRFTDCPDSVRGKEVLNLLAWLILKKAPPCLTGGKDLKIWQPYPLDLKMMYGGSTPKDASYFSSILDEALSLPVQQKFIHLDSFVNALIILPHLRGVEGFSKTLTASLSALFDMMDGNEGHESLKKENILFCVSEAVIASVLLKDEEGRISRHIPCDKVMGLLLPLAKEAKGLPALRAVDVYFTAQMEDRADEEVGEGRREPALIGDMYSILNGNLSSPFREVCRLTLSILRSVEAIEMCQRSEIGIFNACLEAEDVPLTIHDFRQKIGLMDALASLSDVTSFPSFSSYEVILQYLLGIYFANFKLLWEPTCKLIASLARGNPKLFWKVFFHQLKLSMHYVRVERGWKVVTDELVSASQMAEKWEHHCCGCLFTKSEHISAWYNKRFALCDSPDFINYRIQLLNTMCEIVEVCEARNRDVSEIFLTFYKEEFLRSDSNLSPVWDIRKAENDVDLNETSDVALGEEESESNDIESSDKPHILSCRSSTKSMIAFLKLLSRMRNPRAMYKEPELALIFENLMSHRHAEIQQQSLDCLLNYRCKSLLSYRENLLGLIDEKKFKSEMNLFRVDKDSEQVKVEHRIQLMPLVMRILYSKMLSGNKRTAQQRRALVLGFIAGCHDSEISIFLKMAFSVLIPYIGGMHEEVADVVRSIKSSINLEKALHPKRLLSVSNLLVVVVERLGNLLLPLHPSPSSSPIGSREALEFLIRCLLCANALIAGEYAQKDLIHSYHLASLRSARAAALAAVATFFRRLNYSPWPGTSTKSNKCGVGDVEALFEAAVWPWLDQLPTEGIHSPTAFLKLIIVWSENPRYYPLLAKQRFHPGGGYESIIPAVMTLLSGDKTRPSVINAILDIVERLLTYESCEEAQVPMETSAEKDLVVELPPLDVGPMIELPTENKSNLNVSQGMNFGSKLILPHVPCILRVLTQRFTAVKKGGSLSPRDLRVLSLLSELVWSPEDSESLIALILPVATHKASYGTTGEQMCQLLTTANNLIHNVPNPGKFLRAIAPLFSTVDGRSARSCLCEILDTVASRSEHSVTLSVIGGDEDVERMSLQEDLKNTARIVKSLNSWDPVRLEEPDYAQRLDTYKELKRMRESQNEKFPLILGILVIHNSFYVIRNEKDLSLRESAGHCLQTLAPFLAISSSSNRHCRNLVLGETVLALIAKALKDRKCTDSMHHDTIGTLGALVHQCSTLHPVLRDLSRLSSQDAEVDFFENMRHLQLHRRGRALMRFVQDAKESQKPMGPQTLTNIILPLSFHYLFNLRYAKNNSLVDAAIEAVGAACHCLPWHQYQAILKHQLGQLQKGTTEFGRQPIRLIVAILNNFHFNLSRAGKEDVEPMDMESAEAAIDESTQPTSESEGGAAETVDESTYEAKVGVEEEVGQSEMVIGTEEVEDDLSATEKNEVIEVPAWSQDVLLPPSAARRARVALSTVLLPRLHAILVAPTERDSSHKLNRLAGGAIGTAVAKKDAKSRDKGTKGEEETLVIRVPIALAAVKMLQRLPLDFLDQNLSGILLKVLAFLMCRLESVRRVARETLVEIGVALGASHLPVIVRDMCSLPRRGYAFHVLAFTAHALLVAMVPVMEQGDMDKCLLDFMEICKADLFGDTSEEKEITKITGKVYEARAHKSYDTIYLIAKVVSESCLIDLVQPLKEILDQTHSFKVVKIAKECLSRIVRGFIENKFLSAASLLAFSFGLLSKSITALWPSAQGNRKERQLARRTAGAYAGAHGKASMPLELPPDPFLIPKEPRKAHYKTSGSSLRGQGDMQANAHAMLEFGLHLLHTLLKKEQIRWRRGGDTCVVAAGKEAFEVDLAMLEPLVPIICECLESKSAKLTTLALSSFRLMVRMDLPSMENHIEKAASSVYSILHKYAGATSGDNYNMAVSAFKTVAVLIRNVRTLTVEEDHLSALLTCVSRDLDLGGETGGSSGGPARTATAFGVIRSVIARRLRSPIIPPLMMRVAKLSVSAQAPHIQAQSRQVFLQFLMDYPLNKQKLERHVAFFLGQLDYELLSGRQSALEFIYSMISLFPEDKIKQLSGIMFVSLSARLMEEEVPDCRRHVATVIKSLLMRLPHQSRDQLFDIVLTWMKDSEVVHQQVAAQLCGIFVLAEGDAFSAHLGALMPLIVGQLQIIYEPIKTDDQCKKKFKLFPKVNATENSESGKQGRMPYGGFLEQSDDLNVECHTPCDNEPGKYVKINNMDESESDADGEESVEAASLLVDMEEEGCGGGTNAPLDSKDPLPNGCKDMEEFKDPHLFQILQLILKIFMTCPETQSKPQWMAYTNQIAEITQSLLAHPHEWIRLVSCQILGVVFGAIDAADVAVVAARETLSQNLRVQLKGTPSSVTAISELPFLMVDVEARLKSLVLDLSAQLDSQGLGFELAEQVVKNLVFLARVMMEIEKHVKCSDSKRSTDEEEKKDTLCLSWMFRKMRVAVNTEVARTPNQTAVRCAVFKWLAAVTLELSSEPDNLQGHLRQILEPVIREIEYKPQQGGEPKKSKERKELRRLAYEVSELIKEKAGMEAYATAVSAIERRLRARRVERKRIRAQEAVNMPEKAAKRKIKKQLVKKQMKKRKISIIKGQILK